MKHVSHSTVTLVNTESTYPKSPKLNLKPDWAKVI